MPMMEGVKDVERERGMRMPRDRQIDDDEQGKEGWK